MAPERSSSVVRWLNWSFRAHQIRATDRYLSFSGRTPRCFVPEYTGAMAEENDKRVRAWRIVGWVVALLAVVIVAGPQIIDLLGE
jgi:hypothetical protein